MLERKMDFLLTRESHRVPKYMWLFFAVSEEGTSQSICPVQGLHLGEYASIKWLKCAGGIKWKKLQLDVAEGEKWVTVRIVYEE